MLPLCFGALMKLLSYFDDFLKDTVNLNQTRLDQLDSHVKAILKHLEADPVIGVRYKGYVPQGSWAHRTIIKPLPNDEFDADFLLSLEEDPEWTKSPKRYLQEARAAFRSSAIYADKVSRKNRCIRISYANDCHVDVVPYLLLEDGRQVIVNYAEDQFEDTNPEGFTCWMQEKDELTKGNLRRVIRLIKYLRDFKNTFSCPSVILTTLLGGNVQAFGEDSRYSDVPTTLFNLLNDLDAWLQLYPRMPIIGDPSCPDTTFNHRWTESQYSNFRNMVSFYAKRVTEAYHEPDLAKSLEVWQTIFGPAFKKPVTDAAVSSLNKTSVSHLGQRAPYEEFIEEKGFRPGGGFKAQIYCTVKKMAGFRSGNLRSFRTIGKSRRLSFRIETDAPKPYDLYWKVRNTGAEAEQAGGLRGQLLEDNGTGVREETTSYRGQHYVEAYIVKDGLIVARDHHKVNIG